jgi:predicted RNA-binding Zn ribbon-like protein
MDLVAAARDEQFLLDLLNSTPVIDGAPHDELHTAAAGRRWLRAHGHTGSRAEWQNVRAARATLQAIVRGQQRPEAVGPLLSDLRMRPSASDAGVHWQLEVRADQAAATRAVLAWDTLHRTRPGRLRACENSECALFLIDRSKPNQARWCSMAVCGNRMKARRHHARARSGADV